MKHFKSSEFTCRCGCGGNNMQPKFLQMIDNARGFANCPFKITSGTRCFEHNKRVGGSATSSHLSGVAADIKFSNELQLVKIVYGLTKAGFTRIGVNSEQQFVHVDNDKTKPSTIFTY